MSVKQPLTSEGVSHVLLCLLSPLYQSLDHRWLSDTCFPLVNTSGWCCSINILQHDTKMHVDIWSLGNGLLNLYLPSKGEDKKPEIYRRDMSLFLLSKATLVAFPKDHWEMWTSEHSNWWACTLKNKGVRDSFFPSKRQGANSGPPAFQHCVAVWTSSICCWAREL